MSISAYPQLPLEKVLVSKTKLQAKDFHLSRILQKFLFSSNWEITIYWGKPPPLAAIENIRSAIFLQANLKVYGKVSTLTIIIKIFYNKKFKAKNLNNYDRFSRVVMI